MLKSNLNIKKLPFKNYKKEYFLTYLSIAMLNPTIAYYNFFHVIFTVIVVYEFYRIRLKIDKLFLGTLLFLNFISIAQAITFGTFTTTSYLGVFLTFLMPYFIARIMGNRYWHFYINIVYYLAIISLIFWSLQNISDSFTNLLFNISSSFKLDPISNESVIIYNLEFWRPSLTLGLLKNAGFTAEGGLYSCVLILALFFNSIYSKKLLNKKNLIFIISLLSTNSTAGYAALGIYLIGTSLSFSQKSYKIILLPISVVLFYLAIVQLPFMFDKVSKYYQQEMEIYHTTVNPSRVGRFLSARVDLDIIVRYPIWGQGIHKETRYRTLLEEQTGYSNSYLGIVGLASRYGLITWILYFYYLFIYLIKFISMNNINKIYSIFFLLSILAVATGQNPFFYPPYFILAYLGYYLRK